MHPKAEYEELNIAEIELVAGGKSTDGGASTQAQDEDEGLPPPCPKCIG